MIRKQIEHVKKREYNIYTILPICRERIRGLKGAGMKVHGALQNELFAGSVLRQCIL